MTVHFLCLSIITPKNQIEVDLSAWKSYTSRTDYRIADINTVRCRLADNRFFFWL